MLKTLHTPLLCKLHTISQRSNLLLGLRDCVSKWNMKTQCGLFATASTIKLRLSNNECYVKQDHIPLLHYTKLSYHELTGTSFSFNIFFNSEWFVPFVNKHISTMSECCECGKHLKMEKRGQLSTDLGEVCEIQQQRTLHIFCSNLGKSTCNLICWVQWYVR